MNKTIFQKLKTKGKNLLKVIGPGFITGAADDDPSGIGTYSIAGAKYGLLLAWVVPFQLPLMYCIQEMCGRIALVTGKGLCTNMKEIFPKTILYVLLTILIFTNLFNIGADIAIMGASITMLTALPLNLISIIVTTIITITIIFVSYHIYSRILLILSASLAAYIISTFMLKPDWALILQYTIIPHMQLNRDFILVLTGFIGTTISPYLFFWQTSEEIEEIEYKKAGGQKPEPIQKTLEKDRKDTLIGMIFSQLIAFFIVVTCYQSLHLNGITEISTAQQAASALKPFAGEWAYLLFTLGIIGAGFLGIPVLAASAAYALAELLDWQKGLAKKPREAIGFYSVIALATILGLGINFIGINPIQVLLYAAVINCIASVPITAFVLLLANNKKIMGTYKNGLLSNVGGWLTFATVFISSLLTLMYW